MKSLSRPLVLTLAGGLAGLASACSTPEPASTHPPVTVPDNIFPRLGGGCSYVSHPGTFTVTKLGRGGSVHFAFHLPAGEPSTWDGKPDINGMNQHVARFEGDLIGEPMAQPALGASFPGVRREELRGTCTPWVYQVSVGGETIPLEPAS